MKHVGTKALQTQRLTLRRYAVEDAPAMFRNWASDAEVTRYLTWPPHASVDETRRLLKDWAALYEQPDIYHWGLELKRTGEVIGDISVAHVNETIDEAELGWCIGRAWWGQGLMPEAARAVLRWLFDGAGFNRVCARHDVENPKSGRVMQKIGMRFEGIQRQAARNNRGIVDIATYAILRSDRSEQKVDNNA